MYNKYINIKGTHCFNILSIHIVVILPGFNRYKQAKPVVENKLIYTVNVLRSFG
jgi:hypothetical protein